MISEQIKKRDNSFYIVAIVLGLFGTAIFVGEHFFPSPDSDIVPILVSIIILLVAIGNGFLFKGFYHWSKAKGYPGNYCLFCFLGPLGLFILYRLNDLTSE
jgi:drug/metabolite transporter (DMT)-like permease